MDPPARVPPGPQQMGFAISSTAPILLPMMPPPKPWRFGTYAIVALPLTVLLLFMFWIEASLRVGWADAVLAFAASVLFVLAIFLARGGDKAKWIIQPTLRAHLVRVLGVLGLGFGSVYADGYLLHGRNVTFRQLGHDVVFTIVLAASLWWTRTRPTTKGFLL